MLAVAYGCSDNPSGSTDTAPGPPRNLRAIDVSDASVDLEWDAPADSAGVTGYRVWWKKSGSTTGDSADVAAPSTRQRITGLVPGAAYNLAVASKRGSKISPPATIDWMSILPPSGLTVSFSGYAAADLKWTASADAGATGYLLSWKSAAGDTSSMTIAAGATSAQLTTVTADNSYTFYLRTRHEARTSAAVTVGWTAAVIGAPTSLQALSTADSGVKLRWVPPTDSGTIGYIVSWRATAGGDSGTAAVSDAAWTSPKLTPGSVYEFSVRSARGIYRSPSASISWAPAARYTLEPANATLLTIYEQGSPYGNILAIDPAVGGPRRLNAAGAPSPNSLQLALFVSGPNPSTFEIGPAYGFPSFGSAFGLDTGVFISRQSYIVGGLDSWFVDGSLEGMFDPTGNVSEFVLPTTSGDGAGIGFVARTGTPGSYHYARIFIVNVSGELLQGASPNRFINLEVSYQLMPNVPYAKAGMAGPRPATIGARRRSG
jgi:hypothetical protein